MKKKSGTPLHPCHVNFNLAINIALGIQLSLEATLSHYEGLKEIRQQKKHRSFLGSEQKNDRQEEGEWVILPDDDTEEILGTGKDDSWVVNSSTESYVYQLPCSPY